MEKYKGNILQFNNPRDAFGTAMYWQGIDINSDNEEDWNRALELLIANELSIRDIAFACGFSDEKYFSRAFKNQYGYPPSQMKKHISM